MSLQTIGATLNGRQCLLANPAYSPEAAKATAYTCPVGPEPGRAYVLMLRRDLNIMQADGSLDVALSLSFTAGKRVTFPRMYFRHAINVSPGAFEQSQAAYLVELVDVRHLLQFTSINSQYNVRCPAPPGDTTDGSLTSIYYQNSLSAPGFNVETWATMLENLWIHLPAALAGAAPSLPYTPGGRPDGWKFIGVSAWCAIHEFLDKLHCTTAYDPVADTFSIVALGATQTGLASAHAVYGLDLGNADPISSNATLIPFTVRVFFHRMDKNYGTEPSVPRSGNWAETPAYSVDVATGATGAIANTVAAVWDDLPALIDYDGTVNNQSALNARAAEVAAKWLQRHGLARSRRIFQGIASEFRPGSEVKCVQWRNVGGGFVTEVVQYPDLPGGDGCEPCAEHIRAPDLPRHSFPVYPPTDQLVQVDGGYEYEGSDLVASNSSGLWSGVVLSGNPANLSESAACWIAISALASTVRPKLVIGKRYIGRLFGSFAHSSDTRPLFLIDQYPDRLLGKTDSEIRKGTRGWVSIYQGEHTAEADTGYNVLAMNKFADVAAALWVWVDRTKAGFYLTAAECGTVVPPPPYYPPSDYSGYDYGSYDYSGGYGDDSYGNYDDGGGYTDQGYLADNGDGGTMIYENLGYNSPGFYDDQLYDDDGNQY